jgi:hypothetical protein
MLSEKDGVKILTQAFNDQGFHIDNDVVFDEDGVVFDIDGWDAAARVGFEYRTAEAGDKRDLSDDELWRLGARIERGELALLIVDDTRVPDAETLRQHAARFLEIVAARKKTAQATTKKKAKAKAKAKASKRGAR